MVMVVKLRDMRTNIKQWYMLNFPEDSMANEINGNVTFKDLFKTLDTYGDVYDLIGAYDSVIRERLFSELAKIIDVDYSYVYNQWLSAQ